MKDSKGLKTALCLSCYASINHCLTDLLPSLTASVHNPPAPHARHSRCSTERVSTIPSLQSDSLSLAQPVPSSPMLHSQYTQAAQSRHAARASHASLGCDWLEVGVTTSSEAVTGLQIYYLFSCGNVADDVVTFGETDKH